MTHRPAEAQTTASGLATLVLKPGSGGPQPTLRDSVRLNFTAYNGKGEPTDGSEQRGGPVTFEVAGVIAGFREALQLMSVGEQRRLWVPDHLAYPGRPGPPRPDAVFDVELLEIIQGLPALPAPPDVAAVPETAKTTRSGLSYRILHKGTGSDSPGARDEVAIRYVGWTRDGEMFTRSREAPARYTLEQVIPGFREALELMSVGDKLRMWVPEKLAYQGRKGEPRGTLVYDLELVEIEHHQDPPQPPAALDAAPADAKTTSSGLAYRLIGRGSGQRRPTADDRVKVTYSAWTSDGSLFDSTVMRGKPATLPLRRLIPGWAEGLQLMAEGDKAQFWIPQPLAYGGRDGAPKGMLVYEVELLQIMPAQPGR